MAKRKKNTVPTQLWVILALLILGGGIVLHQNQTQQEQAQEQKAEQAAVLAAKENFIKSHAPYAKRLQSAYGILPSVTLAQAVLESDWGKSTLASDYHNLFGIKGDSVANTKEMTTKEYVNGQWIMIKARFRVYADDAASMKDHALLFVNGTTWNPKQYQAVLDAKDYKTAAAALATSGYATDPDYPAKLIQLVETYHLDQYD